jgi:acetyl esterase/lipase
MSARHRTAPVQLSGSIQPAPIRSNRVGDRRLRQEGSAVPTRSRLTVAIAVSLVALVVLASCTAAEDAVAPPADSEVVTTAPGGTGEPVCAQPGLPTTVAYETFDGVDPDLTSLDIHAPVDACDAPVVIWVHGGGYQKGDKAGQVRDKITLFDDNGWILVSVNYRLTDPADPQSANFPDHFDDVASAVAWVHENIASYGGDPSRVALLGHSAGADIVSNVTVNPDYLEKQGLGLDAVVCAGPLDTEGFDKAAAGADDPDGEQEQWKVALGENPDYLAETSATLLVEPGIGIPPTIGVVRGTPRRQAIESDFLDTLSRAGVPTVSIDARSLSHNEVNTRIGAPGDTVMTPPLVAFLTDCFAPVEPRVLP